MKLMSYTYDNALYWGVFEDGWVYPASVAFGEDVPKSLYDYVRSEVGLEIKHPLNRAYAFAFDEVQVKAPFLSLNKNIFCIGKNYYDHIYELDPTGADINQIAEVPVVFTKPPTAVNGPYDNVPSYSHLTKLLDYEAELGVIIGKTCTNVTVQESMDFVFGYTVMNDITARDIQRKTSQWFLGKSLDRTCPMGPVIVTKDEIEDVQSLKVVSRVNGEIRQYNNTAHMIYRIPQIISILSQGRTLNAGDVISTGTPSGVGVGFNPPRTLKKGDLVEVEIEHIGAIQNLID